MNQRIENLLQVSLEAAEEELERSPELFSGYNPKQQQWEVIVKYTGDISRLELKYRSVSIKELLNQYAILTVSSELVEQIAQEPYIEFMEKPKRLFFDTVNGKMQSCITTVQSERNRQQGLFGRGVLVAIIDSGINVANREFLGQNGTTRIRNIWDQDRGLTCDKSQIDLALSRQQLEDIPGRDINGHGTSVAEIACGRNGVASQSDILVVKLGMSSRNSFPRTTQLMEAVDYVMKKGIEYEMPVAVNISFGTNYGDHTGTSLLETFLDDAARSWKSAICVGSGNEGLGATHTLGYLQSYEEQIVEVGIGSYETSVNIQIWKEYWDEFEVEIITPSGKNVGRISQTQKLTRIYAEDTTLLTFYGQPSPYSISQEIYIDMIPRNDYITEGIWKLKLISGRVISGRYDMWLPGLITLNRGTGFLAPDSRVSSTIPSTAARVISVGAYDSRTDALAPFSGHGISPYGATASSSVVKPDILAPGVEVLSASGRKSTGTSFAVPFVTGSAALFMGWGIVEGNDPFLYGEKLKAYLIKGARHLPGYREWPNSQCGYGALCVSQSLPR